MQFKFIHSALDYSGYGCVSRNLALSMDDYGVPITITNVSFASNESLIPASELARIKSLINKSIDYDVVLIYLTPENFHHFIEPDKLNIGVTMFEVSAIPNSWSMYCNQMDLILVPSEFCKKVFIDSGVTKPVEVVHIGTNIKKFDGVEPLPMIKDQYSNKFKWYSIFQWAERKDPVSLLRAYYSAFSDSDDVVLILKTYSGTGSPNDVKYVIKQINDVKTKMGKDHLPPVKLLPDLMTEDQINQIHVACDCYLAPVRGEGHGQPPFDSTLAGKQIITTNYSSQIEFLDPDLHYLIPYQMCPITNMGHIPWYRQQEWSQIDVIKMSEAMQEVYTRWKNGESILPRNKNAGMEKLENYKKWLAEEYDNKNVVKMLLEKIALHHKDKK